MTKKTKKQPTAAEYTKRLGPVRKVVKMIRASDTRGSYNLHLECKHVRRGTKRATVRCGRCKAGK